MSFSRQQRSRRQQQRGTYVTKACTNCQQKHAKCSGRVTCERCTLRNLECTFIGSSKKRGPKTNIILNGSENDFGGIFVLSSVIPNRVQGHTSTLSSTSEYLQQPNNINEFIHYSNFYEEQDVHAFQESGSVLYQAHTDTGY
ncbi:41200_t:CDS:1, partial [Gigaspora margarita]